MIKDNRGYMLIEVILASAIAFGIGYFILSLTINLKNKNDDFLVKTMVATDQAIIMNKLASYKDPNLCTNNNLRKDGKKLIYRNNGVDTTIVIGSDYTSFGAISCTKDTSNGAIHIVIPIPVKQLPDDNFDVDLWYKY